MTLLTLTDFIGRLHPLVVHLPIGILLLACIFQLVSFLPRYQRLAAAVPAITAWGLAGALLSGITGMFLANNASYESDLVSLHQNFGIALTLSALALYWMQRRGAGKTTLKIASTGVLLLITCTGHLGGSLTHGSDYLSSAWNDEASTPAPIADIQEQPVYEGIVQPILEARCIRCHGSVRKKGELRLDSWDHMLTGGESGPALVPGKAEESELITRIFLPLDSDDHMPPKGKPQPGQHELTVLQWWVAAGADRTRKAQELEQPEEVRAALLALESGLSAPPEDNELPPGPVGPADEQIVKRLRDAGVTLTPVAQGSNFLAVSFVSADTASDQFVSLLEQIAPQVVHLRLDDSPISDSAMRTIAKLQHLTRLHIRNTAISDQGIAMLDNLKYLRLLNLTGTAVSAEGLFRLRGLENLKSLYLYRTRARAEDWPSLQEAFPKATLDSGGYRLPLLPTDTTRVRLPGE